MPDLLSGLIASKTRIKLLIRFFLNPDARSYLRELAREFNISSNAVRAELNQLNHSQLIMAEKKGRQIFYSANKQHPLFPELKQMVAKVVGFDQVIENIAGRLGELEYAYVLDDYAQGRDSGIIDLLLVGDVNAAQLDDLTKKTEKYIKRKIRTLVLSGNEYESFRDQIKNRPRLLIWQREDDRQRPETVVS